MPESRLFYKKNRLTTAWGGRSGHRGSEMTPDPPLFLRRDPEGRPSPHAVPAGDKPIMSRPSRLLRVVFLEPRVLFSLAAGRYEGWYSGRVIGACFLAADARNCNCSVN